MTELAETSAAPEAIGKVTVLRVAVGLLGVLPVMSLLAWVYDLGPFRTWFVLTGLPAVIALLAISVASWKRGWGGPGLRLALVSGSLGGLAGAVGYDLFRIPFIVAGLRLFAPVDSYGILLLGASESSSATGFAGWGFHFTNGVGFGIAYAMVALGRRWPWAVLWGVILETATIITPFADSYALRGRWDLIAIAYAAHLAYGVPLGVIVQRAAQWQVRRPLILPASVVLAVSLLGLLVWLRPGSVSERVRAGRHVAPGPSAAVVSGRFEPEWLRVPEGECVTLRNDDEVAYDLPEGNGTLQPGEQQQLCLERVGAHRVRLDSRPFSGGFVLVDPSA